jgi:hypothetical protein
MLVLNGEGELLARGVVSQVKDVSGGLEQIGRSSNEDGLLRHPILQRLADGQFVRSQNVLPQPILSVTAIQGTGPGGFPEPVPASPAAIKPIPGISSALNDVPGAVSEHRVSVPVDLHGESGLLGKGERVQNFLETSVRSVGLDPSGGQGLGAGMNHSFHPQAGFQQQSTFPGQGIGLRALEERSVDLPAPTLQRLQMDVQLSENQRVHIDVGVHNRQVYAGLVMDHSVLRNLAAQFIPQLENQLAEVDLELQEFSAEVREEREHDADILFQDSESHEPQESPGRSQGELNSAQSSLDRYEERGLHFVA